MRDKLVTVLFNDTTAKFEKPKGNVKSCVKKRISLLVRRYYRYLRAILVYFDVILTSYWGVNFIIGRSPFDTVILLQFRDRLNFHYRRHSFIPRACCHSLCHFNPRVRIYHFQYFGVLFDPENKINALCLVLNLVLKIPLNRIFVRYYPDSIFVDII
jgi:hypothetical protein